jgi:hypothetical protein
MPNGESFGEVLSKFKKIESPESIFPLLEDIPLCNALIAWKAVKIIYKAATDCTETIEQARWEWLWSQIEYDQKDFGVVAGCKGQEAPGMLSRLRGLRLIYPDGTINNYAKQYLAQVIILRIQGRKKPPPTISSAK